MTQEDFDSLAIFVAVAEELRREPFFSEDNHEKLGNSTEGGAAAVFCHPMFLKSAVLPFRKIWMDRERCAFKKRKAGAEGIRELVFREHPDKVLLHGHRYWFYDSFEAKLRLSFGHGWATESSQEIIDLWLNTQIFHTGPKDYTNKRKWERDLADFNACDGRIGRAKFEFLFRSSLATIGHSYIAFERILAFPLFKKMRDEQGMIPSFDADVALKYNPYPDPKYRIHFEDVFWHLQRETVEESFQRLLRRHRFSSLGDFFCSMFENVNEAIDCVNKCNTFDALLDEAKVIVLKFNSDPGTDWKGRFNANSYPELGLQSKIGSFEAFGGRKVRFYNEAHTVLNDLYPQFVAAFNEARQQQKVPWFE